MNRVRTWAALRLARLSILLSYLAKRALPPAAQQLMRDPEPRRGRPTEEEEAPRRAAELVPLPSANELDYARGLAAAEDRSGVRVCRGPKCMRGGNPKGCPDCYRVEWHDRRSSAEILHAIERGDG